MKLRSGYILPDATKAKTAHVAALMREHIEITAKSFGVEEKLLGLAALYKCICTHFDFIYTHDSFVKFREVLLQKTQEYESDVECMIDEHLLLENSAAHLEYSRYMTAFRNKLP